MLCTTIFANTSFDVVFVEIFLLVQCGQILEKRVAQIFPKLPKQYPRYFYLKSDVFQNCLKCPHIFQLLTYAKNCHQKLQKSPNLVTLVISHTSYIFSDKINHQSDLSRSVIIFSSASKFRNYTFLLHLAKTLENFFSRKSWTY